MLGLEHRCEIGRVGADARESVGLAQDLIWIKIDGRREFVLISLRESLGNCG